MARLLEHGGFAFLGLKFAIGAIAVYILSLRLSAGQTWSNCGAGYLSDVDACACCHGLRCTWLGRTHNGSRRLPGKPAQRLPFVVHLRARVLLTFATSLAKRNSPKLPCVVTILSQRHRVPKHPKTDDSDKLGYSLEEELYVQTFPHAKFY